jgi:hypothetical protein
MVERDLIAAGREQSARQRGGGEAVLGAIDAD